MKNLKQIKNHRLGFLFAVESNWRVSLEKGTWVPVRTLDIPDDGFIVWLKKFGYVKLFQTKLKDPFRHYVAALPREEKTSAFEPLAKL
jgi:hypothetical protein